MTREKLRRFLFVATACLLSIPWLTPCAGIWSAAIVDGTHNAVTHRDALNDKLPTQQLKEWAAKDAPRLKVRENQPIPASMWITDAELSSANGGRNAPRPGTLVGKGASAVVDGLTYTLTWVDPATWIFHDLLDTKPSTPRRQLILREKPFVMLQGDDIRYTREGKDGPVLLARARKAWITIITPEGSYSSFVDTVHYRAPADELLLKPRQWFQIQGAKAGSSQTLEPLGDGQAAWMRLDFVKGILSCGGKVKDPTILSKEQMWRLRETLVRPAAAPAGASPKAH